MRRVVFYCFFFFNDTATTEIYTLSLHDALPISRRLANEIAGDGRRIGDGIVQVPDHAGDRKSTRLNSSHSQISYAVFCLKKNNNYKLTTLYSTSRNVHHKYH